MTVAQSVIQQPHYKPKIIGRAGQWWLLRDADSWISRQGLISFPTWKEALDRAILVYTSERVRQRIREDRQIRARG